MNRHLVRSVVTLAGMTLVLLLASAGAIQAQDPPGNDGDACHGANLETCRPDPQPSHGADCDPHGANPDGNDDHCGTEAPTSTPTTPTPTSTPTPSEDPIESSSPTPSPSSSPSSTPSSTPSGTPTTTPTSAPSSSPSSAPSRLHATPPPTDTEADSTTISLPGISRTALAFVIVLAIVVFGYLFLFFTR